MQKSNDSIKNAKLDTSNDIKNQSDLIRWINAEVNVNMKSISELKAGTIYCLLLHNIFPRELPMRGVYFNTTAPNEIDSNFRLIHRAFCRLGIRDMPQHELVKSMGKFKFAIWFHKFYMANRAKQESDEVVIASEMQTLRRSGPLVTSNPIGRGHVAPRSRSLMRGPQTPVVIPNEPEASFPLSKTSHKSSTRSSSTAILGGNNQRASRLPGVQHSEKTSAKIATQTKLEFDASPVKTPQTKLLKFKRSMSVTPKQSNSSKATPMKETPKTETPTKKTPMTKNPIRTTSSIESPKQKNPINMTFTKETLKKKETPIKKTPMIETPMIETPMIETPMIETPMIQTPMIQTPMIKTSMIGKTLKKETPMMETQMKETSTKETPTKEMLKKKTPIKKTPIMESPTKESPNREVPTKIIPMKETLMKETPMIEETLKKETPMVETPMIETQMKETSAKETPTKKTSMKVTPEGDAPIQCSTMVDDEVCASARTKVTVIPNVKNAEMTEENLSFENSSDEEDDIDEQIAMFESRNQELELLIKRVQEKTFDSSLSYNKALRKVRQLLLQHYEPK